MELYETYAYVHDYLLNPCERIFSNHLVLAFSSRDAVEEFKKTWSYNSGEVIEPYVI